MYFLNAVTEADLMALAEIIEEPPAPRAPLLRLEIVSYSVFLLFRSRGGSRLRDTLSQSPAAFQLFKQQGELCGRMLHCGDPIGYANLNTNYWQSHLYAYGRLP